MTDRCLMTFDPGRRTGYAIWKQGMAKPRAGTIDMPDTKDIGVWSLAFRDWALPYMRLEGVTDVASEAPIIAVHSKKPADPLPGRAPPAAPKGHIDVNVVVFHVGILVTIEQVRAELGLPPVVRAYRSQVVKHFTGSGKGKRDELKRRCLVQCQATGWNVLDENTADALAVLDWFAYETDQATPWDCSPRAGGLFTPAGAKPPVNKVEDAAVNRIANEALRFADKRVTF